MLVSEVCALRARIRGLQLESRYSRSRVSESAVHAPGTSLVLQSCTPVCVSLTVCSARSQIQLVRSARSYANAPKRHDPPMPVVRTLNADAAHEMLGRMR